MKISLIAHTRILLGNAMEASGYRWRPDPDEPDASLLSEFGGRTCYQSWRKPNPATATTTGYIANILDHEHFSVLEHGSVSLYLQGVSRSLTHELVRHRHSSPSELSQRFVMVEKEGKGDTPFVIPPLYQDDDLSAKTLQEVWEYSIHRYDWLVARHLPRLLQRGVDPHKARKMAREAARSVLPNMTPTAILLTANHRAWRELLVKRGSIHADAEIRQMALAVYDILNHLEPAIYQDFRVSKVDEIEVLERV